MKKNVLFFVCIAVILCLSGCRINDDLQRLYVKAIISCSNDKTLTKAETNAFTSDSIGVYVDDEDGLYAPAVNSTAVVSSGRVTSAPGPDIFINAPATVYAYYPASANELNSPDSTFTKSITVSLTDDFSASGQIDYLWATPTDVSRTNRTNVSLTFYHALAKVVFRLTLAADYAGNPGLTQITLTTASSSHHFKYGQGTMSIADGSLTLHNEGNTLTYSGSKTLSGTASDIIALIAPTSLADNISATSDITIGITVGGILYTTALPVNPIAEWACGTCYVYNITVGSRSISISQVDVSGWIEGGGTDIIVD